MTNPARALVIGYGSIGQRHMRLLEQIGLATACVSRRDVAGATRYAAIGEAIAAFRPDYAVIADETARHADSLRALDAAGFRGRLLVEKPVFSRTETDLVGPRDAFVAYNLRFHPVVACLRQHLAGQRLLAAQVHVGQHLADWRPGRDWRQGYSAQAALGGGVLRDLSHEIDYVLHLLGPCTELAAEGGNSGVLDITADDHFALLLRCERCPQVTVTMNYLDRPVRRGVAIQTDAGTVTADFVAGRVTLGSETLYAGQPGRDETYLAQHRAILSGEAGPACRWTEGLAVLAVIEAAERAAASRSWVSP